MSLTYWFDVHSPWVYLATARFCNLARKHGHDIVWRPVHLPRLVDEIGGVKPLESAPSRVAWFRQDILDWADLQNMPLTYHPQYPLRNSRALRTCQLAADNGRAEAFIIRILTGYWTEGADITDLDTLAQWGAESGLERQAVRDAAVSERFKHRVEDNTQAAIARGVFGVPTFDTGEKLYFGNDRLDMLDRHLGHLRQLRASGG